MSLIGEMQYLTIGDSTYSLPSGGGGGGGSVTNVAVENATNGGLSVNGSPITSSGTITVGHSNVLTSAQTTQAVYPIKIDKNGHISAYGSAVTIPTKVSDLTNDSGFTTNTGTVTSVGVSNATNGGLTVSGSPVTSSGSITVGHSNVLTSAQTTQAVYPIKIDKNGHISAYGSAQTIPTKVSDLTNDSGFITGYTETDPTVPSWAKASSKPSYTASEVGAVPTTRTVNGKALSSDITLSASDVDALPSSTTIPTKVSDLTNDSGFTSNTGTVTSVGVSNATNGGLTVSGSPVTGSGSITVGHSNVLTSAQTTQAVYPIKIDKNGHISAYGSAVTSMPASDVYSWAKASTKPSYTASEVGALPSTTSIPSATSDLTNDSGFITSAALPTKVSDLTNDSGFITSYTETDPTVPSWAKASTKPTYTASEVGAVSLTDGYATDSELLDATTIAIWEDILGISEE